MDGTRVAAVVTLGCKLNIADSEEIARSLRTAGFAVVDRLCEADAVVVNTCSVTHVADQKSRRLIRAAQRAAPGAVVAVTGCFPQSAGFQAVRDLGAVVVAGTRDGDKRALAEQLAVAVGPGRGGATPVGPSVKLHTRAFIKAQEGCNDVCAFCIVPRTRGREESRTVEAVVREVGRVVEEGAREVVITGTQLGAWGRDFDPPLRPWQLIAALLDGTEATRIRFSSLQPQDVDGQLLALWADPRLMPHFHLALQSGSDAVLRAMRRRYTAEQYRQAAARIRRALPEAAITTDVIVGFPGEEEEDFAATLAFCREVGVARVHCFPYSPRSKTAAARMPRQVPLAVRQERMAQLQAMGQELGQRFREAHRGTIRPVLWEREHSVGGERLWHGYTDNYLPVYGRGEDLGNRVTPAILGGVYHDGVWGDVPGGGA
ncbi:MAG: tRNA (N(6)-L-threonylcarbamoyladenosine(37)-C(2))-methylthiotransferase MtaB [Dehalococcoidia bacterium]|nr:tRNA (N(6)-L-threonylcarbamoyladenosine(37)-C(2))-methylthiotransferase MtaB [Dehalococcoidia bacterium]